MSNASHTVHKHGFEVGALIEPVLRYLERIPVPQAMIVFSALGIFVGHYLQGSWEVILEVSRWLVIATTFGLGSMSLYLLQYERRSYKPLLGFTVVFMYMVSVILFVTYQPEVVRFLAHMIIILFSLVVFIIIALNVYGKRGKTQ